MTLIGTASVVSSAPPEAFFARWADVATWPEWNADTAWVRLDGPFEQGVSGALKPKGGPKVRFVVESLVRHTEFVDVSYLLGARLTFAHRVSRPTPTRTEIRVEVTITGPLAFVWKAILGKGIAASVQPDLDRLASVAESAVTDGR